MNNLSMYCLTLNPSHLSAIKKIGYLPVGLGDDNFSQEWLTDKTKTNISNKNRYYGEYTFHYWIWKNELKNIGDKWIGFCQYRKFWIIKKSNNISSFEDFKEICLKDIPNKFDSYESLIGEPLFVNQFRLSKFIKHNFKKMILNPSLILNEKKRTLKFHFDMMHGDGNLKKAVRLLDIKDRDDFNEFINTEVSFNPHNMFICKNKDILKNYYDALFPWLERCEKEFGFDNLEGYGQQRIYGFLAERFMSYWFKKNTKFSTLPILFKDISNYKL